MPWWWDIRRWIEVFFELGLCFQAYSSIWLVLLLARTYSTGDILRIFLFSESGRTSIGPTVMIVKVVIVIVFGMDRKVGFPRLRTTIAKLTMRMNGLVPLEPKEMWLIGSTAQNTSQYPRWIWQSESTVAKMTRSDDLHTTYYTLHPTMGLGS